jgi:hypothetical protein
MPTLWSLRAWISRHNDRVVAAFVARSCIAERAPATRVCRSEAEARRWIEDEARFLGAAVEWV